MRAAAAKVHPPIKREVVVQQGHIVRSYSEELNSLRSTVTRMGGLAEAQLAAAIEALTSRDEEKARQVIAADAEIDELELETERNAIQLIALRSPVAEDLREVIAALKLASALERIGDYAKNIAKRSIVLSRAAPVKPLVIIPRMAALVRAMLTDVINSYVERDAEQARLIRARDKDVDDLYTSVFRALLAHMTEHPDAITPCAHLMFITKNIERIGDHITNMAEIVYYRVEGRNLDPDRPKSDAASYVTAPSAGEN